MDERLPRELVVDLGVYLPDIHNANIVSATQSWMLLDLGAANARMVFPIPARRKTRGSTLVEFFFG
jgi:hypothetical protein